MHLGHPPKCLGERAAAIIVAKRADDLVEIFSLDRTRPDLLAIEGGRHCFEKPEDFLDSLTRALLEKETIGLIQRGMDQGISALSKRLLGRLDGNGRLGMTCQQCCGRTS